MSDYMSLETRIIETAKGAAAEVIESLSRYKKVFKKIEQTLIKAVSTGKLSPIQKIEKSNRMS